MVSGFVRKGRKGDGIVKGDTTAHGKGWSCAARVGRGWVFWKGKGAAKRMGVRGAGCYFFTKK